MEFAQKIFSEDLAAFLQSRNGMIVAAVLFLLHAFAFCRIFAKAGFNPLLGLLVFVPPVTFFLPFYLAFAPWPQDRELKGLRRMKKQVHKANEKHEHFDKAA
jgi:hypothetical protein